MLYISDKGILLHMINTYMIYFHISDIAVFLLWVESLVMQRFCGQFHFGIIGRLRTVCIPKHRWNVKFTVNPVQVVQHKVVYLLQRFFACNNVNGNMTFLFISN